jgi:hypothetical protein
MGTQISLEAGTIPASFCRILSRPRKGVVKPLAKWRVRGGAANNGSYRHARRETKRTVGSEPGVVGPGNCPLDRLADPADAYELSLESC